MKHRHHDQAGHGWPHQAKLHRSWTDRGWLHRDRLPWKISALIITVLCLLSWAGIGLLVRAMIG